MTEDQNYCKSVLSHWIDGDHHLPPVHPFGEGICINYYGDLSTFDFDRLTRLVLVAHRFSVRIEIASSGPGMVKIIAHRRSLEKQAGRSRWHPDLNCLKILAEDAKSWTL